MKIRGITLALLIAVMFGAMAVPAPVAAQEGLTQPITGVVDNGGTFTGNLHITKFDVQDHKLVAIGTLTGTINDASGRKIGDVNNAVAWPVQRNVTTAAFHMWIGLVSNGGAAGSQSGTATNTSPVAIAQTCDILNLVLGPLDLNLLGLEVHLNRVLLDIVANPLGGLLGSLLCSVANLLNNPLADLLHIADLLNQILQLLG